MLEPKESLSHLCALLDRVKVQFLEDSLCSVLYLQGCYENGKLDAKFNNPPLDWHAALQGNSVGSKTRRPPEFGANFLNSLPEPKPTQLNSNSSTYASPNKIAAAFAAGQPFLKSLVQ